MVSGVHVAANPLCGWFLSSASPSRPTESRILCRRAIRDATELADLVLAEIKRAAASLESDYGEGRGPTPRRADFVTASDGESSTDSWDSRFSSSYPRPLPIRSGLTRKGHEAGVRWRTLGRCSLSDNQ